ncbi:hypothetical protein AAG747_23345 [Rapidithrix thailandica]|uniref:Uncharacterized protein n=1 Tax=Rapidithrix thailandica TaxID=413964 RepID=A0AAW9SEA9_9BACT
MDIESITTGTLLPLAYLLVGLAILAAIVGFVLNAVANPQNLMKSVAGVVLLLVLFGLGYGLASNEVTAKALEFQVNADSSKLIGGMLIMMYELLIVAFVGIIFTEIVKLVK